MKNIRINLISPGTIETSLTSGFSEKSKLTSIRNTPLGRLTEPDDVSNAVIFLASENSSHINGHNLVINGGA
jgi:3-oxoacyl-[acyl-carrier protein] reductase